MEGGPGAKDIQDACSNVSLNLLTLEVCLNVSLDLLTLEVCSNVSLNLLVFVDFFEELVPLKMQRDFCVSQRLDSHISTRRCRESTKLFQPTY
jgi:hypothetical protein